MAATQSLPWSIKLAFAVILISIFPFFTVFPGSGRAAENTPGKESAPKPRIRYLEVVPRPHSTSESLRYLGILYVASTAVYLFVSRDEVFNNASFQNYAQNFGNITFFDQDLPSSNWGVHLLTGMVLYEFYRARSYSLVDSFFMTLTQEALFQFTVETMIVPTALENVWYTGIIGPILGRGAEVLSLPLMNSDFFGFRLLGYLLNLPAAFGLYESTTKVLPIVEKDSAGLKLQMRF